MKNTRKGINVLNELDKANELNDFFRQFDTDAGTSIKECNNLIATLSFPTDDRIIIDPSTVSKVFKRLNTKKSQWAR